jgi:HAD superfamily hydrolase (TIGR01484 family)
MYYGAIASDYDGTLAQDGRVSETTLAALRRFKETGRRLLLVTGRVLPDLKAVFPDCALFDKIVVENGALLYTPASEEERLLAPAPPAEFADRLRALGVAPLSLGRCIVATWEPNETKVLQAVRDLGLELEIIFNKGAVMVLPSGVNKATGLVAALADLGLSPRNVIGVGDAENDHALLRACGTGAAVANALPMLKDAADIVLDKARGDGVAELIDRVLANDATLHRR